MRRTPELVFHHDKGLAKGVEVLGLLGQLEQERQERGPIPEGSSDIDGEL